MREELLAILKKTAPKLYENTTYIECGDGWFNLLFDLSFRLEPLCIAFDCYASQVKEKYGTLRFYMALETDQMSELIRIAEHRSETTCEICGMVGYLNKGPWYKTLCQGHHDKDKEC